MKELIAAVAGLGLLLFVMRNEKAPSVSVSVEGFEPEEVILKRTVDQIQEREPNVYPIDTIYFQKDKTGFIGRFMFLNTDGFYGVQYDVETDGKEITSLKKSVPPEYKSPFSGYMIRQNYKDVSEKQTVNVDKTTMDNIASKLRTENVAVGYYSAGSTTFKESFMKTL